MKVFKNRKDDKLNETMPKKLIDTAETEKVTADTSVKDNPTPGTCNFKPISKTFGRLLRFKATPKPAFDMAISWRDWKKALNKKTVARTHLIWVIIIKLSWAKGIDN